MSKNVIVIGSGFSGLSNALLLSKKGFHVTILEALDRPGGVARVYEKDGFKFDMGPTWYLMPEVFTRFFEKAGIKKEDMYQVLDISPSYRVFYGQNENIDIRRDADHNKKVFESFEPGGGEKLERYLKKCEFKYNVAVGDFLYKDYRKFSDFFSWKLIKNGLKLDPLSSLDGHVRQWFKSEKARKILEFNTVFLGSSPFTTPALYSLMAHVDLTQGIFIPEGGIGRIVEFLVEQCKKNGVTIEYNRPVKKILFSGKQATGVLTEAGEIAADIVLSSADYHHTETELIPREYRNYSERYWKTRVMAPSTLLMYLGVKGQVKNLVHHNFYFAQEWKKNFDQIFRKPEWPQEPSYYVGCPTKTDSSFAPKDCESLFVLVPLAPGLDGTTEEIEAYGKKIITHLEGLMGEEIGNRLLVKHTYSGRDFAAVNKYFKGTALGLSHTLMQTAIFRPSHKNKKASNFYYSGHYTQPGIGMPMAFIGAELVSELIESENRF